MSEQNTPVAREDVEALAEVIADVWVHGVSGVARAVLASSWLADFAEGVRAAERERHTVGPCSCPYCCSGTPVEQRGDVHRNHGAAERERLAAEEGRA